MSEFDNNSYNFSFEPADSYSSEPVNEIPAQERKTGRRAKKKGSGVKIIAIALVCALLGGIGGAGVTAVAYQNWSRQNASAVTETRQPVANAPEMTGVSVTPVSSGVIRVTSNDEGKSLTPEDVYASYEESVVGINCETTTNVYGQLSTAAVAGTGFVLTSDGYIITNNHVVEDANEGSIRVSLINGSTYDAVIVGTEPDNDVALLKIEATGLKPVSIGDSDALVVGERVCAIGNPLGELTNTLSVGYVSALNREVNADGKPISMLQTDCAINPGNSGGPLFDMNGNVIGITTAKYASDELEGLGFAIPINDVMEIVADLMQYGYVKGKAFMGIVPVTIYDTYASYYNLPTGVYVYSVTEGSAAEKAGMKQSDIITKLGDWEVTSYSDLSSALRKFKAGDTTTVTVWRSGEELTLTITFDEKQPESKQQEEQKQEEPQEAPSQDGGSWFGGSGEQPSQGQGGSDWFSNWFGNFGGSGSSGSSEGQSGFPGFSFGN